MSTAPMRSRVSSARRRVSSSLAQSAAIQRASMLAACSSAAACSRSSALRELSMMRAPASPRAWAICRPRPREPPVMSAVLPRRSNSCCTVRAVMAGLSFEEEEEKWSGGLRILQPRAYIDEYDADGRHDDTGHRQRPAQGLVAAAGGKAQDQREQAAVDQHPDPGFQP